MTRVRVIPVLLLDNGRLVKTIQFAKPAYIGDPINAVKIFNEKEVDEIVVLDISATRENRRPDFSRIAGIAGEAFMPMGYGGGVKTVEDIRNVLLAGFEKVIFNTASYFDPNLIRMGSASCGAQSIVVCIDYRKNFFGRWKVCVKGGGKKTEWSPVEFAREMEEAGAGELILQSIERDGMYLGYDLDMIKEVSQAVNIPVVACGGASAISSFAEAIHAGASAVAAGSLFVFRSNARGILINYPSQKVLRDELYNFVTSNE